MNFISEMYEKLHKADAENYKFSVQVFENAAVLLEGHKGLVSLSQDEIKVKLIKGSVTILGSDLFICYISKTELCITGNISGVNYS